MYFRSPSWKLPSMLVGKEASTENVLIKVKAKEEEIVGGLIVQLKLEKIINLFFLFGHCNF